MNTKPLTPYGKFLVAAIRYISAQPVPKDIRPPRGQGMAVLRTLLRRYRRVTSNQVFPDALLRMYLLDGFMIVARKQMVKCACCGAHSQVVVFYTPSAHKPGCQVWANAQIYRDHAAGKHHTGYSSFCSAGPYLAHGRLNYYA